MADDGGGRGEPLLAFVVGDFVSVAWTARGAGAVMYLVVCGSWIGYTAYIWLLEHVPTSKVSTYAYVNPVVAVFLGWLILHERVDRFIVMGSVIVVVSVILVTSAKVKEKTVAEELPAVEAAVIAVLSSQFSVLSFQTLTVLSSQKLDEVDWWRILYFEASSSSFFAFVQQINSAAMDGEGLFGGACGLEGYAGRSSLPGRRGAGGIGWGLLHIFVGRSFVGDVCDLYGLLENGLAAVDLGDDA